MNNSFKLFELLNMIADDKEWKQLEKFFKQFNVIKENRSKIIFKELKKSLPAFNEEPIPVDKEKLSKKIFKKVAVKQLDNYFSDISVHVEQFLVIQELGKNKDKKQEMLTYVMENRGATDIYFNSLKDEIQLAESKEDYSLWRYQQLFNTHFKYFFHPAYSKDSRNQYITDEDTQTPQDLYLSKSIAYLDEFYVLSKIRLACEIINRVYKEKEEYDELLLEEVKALATTKYANHRGIQLYYKLYQYLKEEVAFAPQDIIDFFLNEGIYLPKFERESMIVTLTNILHWLTAKKPTDENKRAVFELYKIGIEGGFYEVEKNISTGQYINIVLYGGFLKELEWTSNFIEKYKQSVPEKERESTYQLCRAVVAFNSSYDGHWDDMMHHLRQVNVEHSIHLNMRVRTYQIIAFVEVEFLLKKNVLPAWNACDNFKSYIRRANFTEVMTTRYLNFINGVREILKAPVDDDTYNRYKNMELVSAHNWLMRTMDRVKNKPIRY